MDKTELRTRLRDAYEALELEEIPPLFRKLLDDDPPPPKFPGGMGARSTPLCNEHSEDEQYPRSLGRNNPTLRRGNAR